MTTSQLSADDRAAINELLAEMLPHCKRVKTLRRRLDGPAEEALQRYAEAGFHVVVTLRRELLGVSHG